MDKVKKTILEIENVRVIEHDDLNLAVERYETYYNPKTKKEKSGWRFKGYAASILGAIQLIHNKELLIDQEAVTDLSSHLNEVKRTTKTLAEIKEAL
ncbi:hypothetical protein [Virgibacillus salexigens]|uniref:Uncharacterized protein n=1 Tax=Virgibacillus kapii TaxID=1638645 RepID=A0ABQ2D7R3_9BACI|nr:hypothetical protein [Virgibacillus kapii]GGJ48895.1 hypothetical protein GCM10007111_08680 [Virgibacillus kapii]